MRGSELKMSRVVVESNAYGGGEWASALSHLFNFPETVEKFVFPPRAHESNENKGVSSIPVDILETPKEYTFYMDVPGLAKSDIQVNIFFPIFPIFTILPSITH